MGNKNRKIWKLIAASVLSCQLLIFPGLVEAATLPASETFAHTVEKQLLDLTKDENSIGMQSAISVFDVTKNEPLYQHHAQKTLIPASNMKLFTTVAALEKLGPEYQYKTEVYLDGMLYPNGKVQGDIILKGYGDPTLSTEDLQSMAADLKAHGIRQIDGRILVDESYFDALRLGNGWMWDDEPYGYSAQLSALALHKNNISLTITPDQKSGGAPTINLEPQTSYIQIVNHLKTVTGEDADVTVTRDRAQNVVTLSGTIGQEAEPYQEDVTMEDPALFVADEWKQELEAAGISLRSKVEFSKTAITTGTPLITHHSKPMKEILVELNKESDNFYAETLLKTLGATQKSTGTAEAGSEVIAEVMKQAGIDAGYRQVDGSGLSRLDLISAEQMVKLLVYVQGRDYHELFEQTLPIAGVDGTLKTRMVGTPAANNLIAKTGSMGGVYCLSGYVKAKNGDKLAFAILNNGVYKSKYARDFQDQLGAILATYPELTEPTDYKMMDNKPYKLASVLDPILDQAALAGVTAGVVVTPQNGKQGEASWYERDADLLLTPASNMKLVTSAAALKQLGEDYRFRTELYASEKIPANGVLSGNLYLKGYGDPTLHTEDPLKVQDGVSIESIVNWLKAQGLQKINGDLIVDESYFDQERLGLGWAWDDESYYYNPLLGALALNRGTVMVEYQPGERAGDPVALTLWPKTNYVTVLNEAKTTEKDSESTLTIERDRATNTIHVKGNLPVDTEGDYERVPVEEPALYAATVLQEKLFDAGILMNPNRKVIIGTVPATATRLNTFQSAPLREILSYMLKKSDNFYAEMLLKNLGAAKGEGSSASGVERVVETVTELGGTTTFDMVDGSGLTRYNQISARQLASVLKGMSQQPSFQTYYDSLPIAGVDGTLKSRMKGTLAEKNVHAKTGSMTGVNSLSGYVTTKSGEKLVFTILLNGYTADEELLTSIQDQLVIALANYHN